MAKPATYIDNNKIIVKSQWCKGCGICIALCSSKVLVLDNRGKAIVANPAACTACGKCASHCPDLAITVNHAAARTKTATPVLPA
ncbi:MAG: 4Fe-4S dicluster domain-containing protein [Desulfotomaculaceae bacterium]